MKTNTDPTTLHERIVALGLKIGHAYKMMQYWQSRAKKERSAACRKSAKMWAVALKEYQNEFERLQAAPIVQKG